jgi:hypothetical protein
MSAKLMKLDDDKERNQRRPVLQRALVLGNAMWVEFRQTCRGLQLVLHVQTLLSLLLTTLAIYFCAPHRLNISFDVPLSVLIFGVIFPLTFSIAENFRRREHANTVLSDLGSCCSTIYWVYRDWAATHSVTEGRYARQTECAVLISQFLATMRLMLGESDPQGQTAQSDKALQNLSSLSQLNERMGKDCGYKMGGAGGLARLTAILRDMVRSVSLLRDIQDYSGTPRHIQYAFPAFGRHTSFSLGLQVLPEALGILFADTAGAILALTMRISRCCSRATSNRAIA